MDDTVLDGCMMCMRIFCVNRLSRLWAQVNVMGIDLMEDCGIGFRIDMSNSTRNVGGASRGQMVVREGELVVKQGEGLGGRVDREEKRAHRVALREREVAQCERLKTLLGAGEFKKALSLYKKLSAEVARSILKELDPLCLERMLDCTQENEKALSLLVAGMAETRGNLLRLINRFVPLIVSLYEEGKCEVAIESFSRVCVLPGLEMREKHQLIRSVVRQGADDEMILRCAVTTFRLRVGFGCVLSNLLVAERRLDLLVRCGEAMLDSVCRERIDFYNEDDYLEVLEFAYDLRMMDRFDALMMKATEGGLMESLMERMQGNAPSLAHRMGTRRLVVEGAGKYGEDLLGRVYVDQNLIEGEGKRERVIKSLEGKFLSLRERGGVIKQLLLFIQKHLRQEPRFALEIFSHENGDEWGFRGYTHGNHWQVCTAIDIENEGFVGKLMHEFTHLVMLVVYRNKTRPFPFGDKAQEIRYKEACSSMEELSIGVGEESGGTYAAAKCLIDEVKKVYCAHAHDEEFIARYCEVLAMGYDKDDKVKCFIKPMEEYWNVYVGPAIDRYISE